MYTLFVVIVCIGALTPAALILNWWVHRARLEGE